MMSVGPCCWQMGRALEILGAAVEAARVGEPPVGLPRPVSQEMWWRHAAAFCQWSVLTLSTKCTLLL
uniref:Alternative protein MAP3K1 n=1 Tax=Homo sapiens TaxID=9606 RepID=L8ECC8_HUMAN|nr:alternative protein MAP3K1 [Homo sapiens]